MARVPEAHLTPPKGARATASGRAYPMAEQPSPAAELAGRDFSGRVSTIRRVVDWLDVERAQRWMPRDSKTYCNVYAADATRTLGAYLPRVWWDSKALARIAAGETVPVVYPYQDRPGTIREMGANLLRTWLVEFGPSFGWQVVAGDDETPAGRLARAKILREELNRTGSFGLISARNRDRNRSGHIVLALPDLVAPELASSTSSPLQSQAGTRNRRLFVSDWYTDKRFDSVVFASFNLPSLGDCTC